MQSDLWFRKNFQFGICLKNIDSIGIWKSRGFYLEKKKKLLRVLEILSLVKWSQTLTLKSIHIEMEENIYKLSAHSRNAFRSIIKLFSRSDSLNAPCKMYRTHEYKTACRHSLICAEKWLASIRSHALKKKSHWRAIIIYDFGIHWK